MKVTILILVLFAMLVLLCTYKGGRTATSSSADGTGAGAKNAAQASSPGGPVAWAPFKDSFTTTEGDPFLIAVDVDCPSLTPTGNEFLLVPPTPSFVHLSPVFIGTNVPRVMGLMSVNPQPGDAGKYQIKVRATPCYGSVGSELTFKLRVKKP
jgi:hypothetical protein